MKFALNNVFETIITLRHYIIQKVNRLDWNEAIDLFLSYYKMILETGYLFIFNIDEFLNVDGNFCNDSTISKINWVINKALKKIKDSVILI